MKSGTKLGSHLRLAALPVVAIVGIVVAWQLGYFELDRRRHLLDAVLHVRAISWAEAAYVAAYALAVSICLPAAIATVVGGAVFGAWQGALLAWLGALSGTTLAHVLAVTVAKAPLRRLFGEHRLLRQLRDNDSVGALFRLRVLPVAPFAVLDYVAGIAGVSLPRLIAATMLGILPSVTAYSYVGSELMAGIAAGEKASYRALWIAAGVTVLMVALSTLPKILRKVRD